MVSCTFTAQARHAFQSPSSREPKKVPPVWLTPPPCGSSGRS
jgi:hypothetical protein